MEKVYRHYELLEMDDKTKMLFLSAASNYKYVTDLQRAMGIAGCKVSRPTLDRLLKGEGNQESINKAKAFVDFQFSKDSLV